MIRSMTGYGRYEAQNEDARLITEIKSVNHRFCDISLRLPRNLNAYENDIACEHRIELNPNIKYSGQKQKDMQQKAAIVKTDEASLIQGMIWSEILGKPKAYQNRAPRFHR